MSPGPCFCHSPALHWKKVLSPLSLHPPLQSGFSEDPVTFCCESSKTHSYDAWPVGAELTHSLAICFGPLNVIFPSDN